MKGWDVEISEGILSAFVLLLVGRGESVFGGGGGSGVPRYGWSLHGNRTI